MKEEYYKTKASVDEYIELAKGVDGKQLIEQLDNFLPNNSSVLEIGTGPGSDWEILRRSYDVTGSDNSSEFLNHLTSEYPQGRFIELDASTLKTDKLFDGIYSNKVLHHLKDEELINSVKRQHDILNTNGLICHSFWKGKGTEIFKGLFVNYHDEDELRMFFGKYFEILLLNHYKEFEDDDSLLLIGRKI